MKRRHRWRRRGLIAVIVIVLMVGVRAVLPSILLHHTNRYLADFSPTYTGHVDDLDISVLRMSYTFEGAKIRLRDGDVPFVKADLVDVSLSWTELFKLRVRTDVAVQGGNLFITKFLLKATEEKKTGKIAERYSSSKEAALSLRDRLFPVSVARLSFDDVSFFFADVPQMPLKDRFRITDVKAVLTNLTPIAAEDSTGFRLRGQLFGTGPIEADGSFYLKKETKDWDLDLVLRDFKLTEANEYIKKVIPMSFTAGDMDLYVEAKSEKGRISGYAKPFLTKVDLLSDQKDFTSVKHFLFDVGASFIDFFLKNPETKTVATRIEFGGNNGDLKFDQKEALDSAVKNSRRAMKPGLEHSVHLR